MLITLPIKPSFYGLQARAVSAPGEIALGLEMKESI